MEADYASESPATAINDFGVLSVTQADCVSNSYQGWSNLVKFEQAAGHSRRLPSTRVSASLSPATCSADRSPIVESWK